LANRLRIGFAICFALLTAMAVIGVGRFISQRQDYENGVERSYQIETAARVRIAERPRGKADRKVVATQTRQRQELQDRISSDTATPPLLVAAGLIAGLTGALLCSAA